VSEEILLKLSLVEDSGMMELAIIDNTIKGSVANQLLYPLAIGISVILEDDPNFLYDAGTELYHNEVYINMDDSTKH
jgi:hypothetical protein